jgi:hypothetical protein
MVQWGCTSESINIDRAEHQLQNLQPQFPSLLFHNGAVPRRLFFAALQQAEEAIVRIAEAHRLTKAALDRALDDVRGRALPQREEADHFL